MKQNITLEIPKNIFEKWNQKLIPTVTMEKFTSITRLCPKDVWEERAREEDIFSDKRDTELTKSGSTNDKTTRLTWQKMSHWIYKSVGALKIKKELQIISQQSDLHNSYILDLQKRFVTV